MAVEQKTAEYLDFYRLEKLVEGNEFKNATPDLSTPPTLEDARHLLPQPFWKGHDTAIASYWKAWEIAFRNLRPVSTANGFIAPFIDTAFNNCLFMWDSCFILMFGKYGNRAFNFQRTLDNLYAKQHKDGFISREIQQWNGQDRFHRYDPASTGPNIMAWCEWEYFLTFGDKERLAKVFPVLMGYHKWCRLFRTWPDGSYHSCGLACGMDNQPRMKTPDFNAWVDHAHTAWIDATCQAALSAQVLLQMAKELDRMDDEDVIACAGEVAALAEYVDKHMWDEERGSFFDRHLATAPPTLSETHTIGAYWALLARLVRSDRLPRFLSHLEDTALFNRPVRTPSLAANHAEYRTDGGYWLGGVWPSTNYMVLRGLTAVKADDLAADIAANYHAAVTALFERTNTHWENMAPELAAEEGYVVPGEPAKSDFVGWGGIGPITVLLEYVFGLRADVPSGCLTWDVRLTDEFGVDNYPFGTDSVLSLKCAARGSVTDEPVVEIRSNKPVTIRLLWGKDACDIGGVAVDRSTRPSAVHEREIHILPS